MSFSRRPFGRGGGSAFSQRDMYHRGPSTSNVETDSQPFGQLLQTIARDELSEIPGLDSRPAKITGCKYAASYSWTDGNTPTILVPGKPPTWTPPKGAAQRLRPDSGQFFRDPNAARYPSYPMEPVVRSLFASQPAFSTADIDIFGCGSTLGNLLRFTRDIDSTFRFNVEVIGNTVFFNRKENSPTELIPDVRGYGHSFPDSYTGWDADVKGSVSHQRIVQYNFAGLRFLVRFGCDGYRKDLGPDLDEGAGDEDEDRTAGSHAPKKHRPTAELADTLTTAFSSLQASQKDTAPKSTQQSSITVKSAGKQVPQPQVFELKTRNARNFINMDDVHPRMWLTQVPHFLVAYHSGGMFHTLRWMDVQNDIRVWEDDNEKALNKLCDLIRRIRDFAKSQEPGAKLEVVRNKMHELEIRRQAGGGAATLPPELKDQWVARSFDDEASYDDGDEENAQLGASEDEDSSEDEDEPDYTACDVECGYCGKCRY